MKKPPTIYTAPDAAKHLGRTVSTIHRQSAATEIGFTSVGGTLLFTVEDVERLKKYAPPRGPRKKQ